MQVVLRSFRETFDKTWRIRKYRVWLALLGVLSMPVALCCYLIRKKTNRYGQIRAGCERALREAGAEEEQLTKARQQLARKQEYFGARPRPARDERQVAREAAARFGALVEQDAREEARRQGVAELTFRGAMATLMEHPGLFLLSLLLSWPMYILLALCINPIVRYVFERLVMMVFVIFGVTFLVFTIFYFSPMKPAENLLGETATEEQLANFNAIYGLDQPYFVQLMRNFKRIVTLDLGKSYQGNEDVARTIAMKLPTTLQLSFWSLVVCLVIAIPSGIISAMKQYSSFDYIFMFIALLGLSIPNFWLGLILILNFSINLGWLPATFVAGQASSFIMPAIVMGTGLSAAVARMTRSSMLEVKGSDYIMTARAKGLPSRKIIFRHILGNALIPIVTVVGLQMGNMIGGSAVTEKVFNVSGLGSYIVDKQSIPDIPVVLAGVVYIAMIVSLVNLFVDILYAFLDPRIKSKLKNG